MFGESDSDGPFGPVTSLRSGVTGYLDWGSMRGVRIARVPIYPEAWPPQAVVGQRERWADMGFDIPRFRAPSTNETEKDPGRTTTVSSNHGGSAA